ncbi:GTP-binding protein [Anoxybacterium hadale]|uniref:GTP-binding protein n=1 Tax=Anoxybacterium hadale TaxID=3408580 RepID=A0ACD1A6F6_9FIRM|nr:GTP-binding protein [Clostridiales bacterium]
MKKLAIGILAHVDAGKTTLSESILYLSGKLGKQGRVDNKDAFLDNHDLERARGITIFSKQAVFEIGDLQVTLLDTPGHADFSAEMERTLQVLDYAILVISGADGVQSHTKTLWRLLEHYKIPAFLFINKMDQQRADRQTLMAELKKMLDEGCIDFSDIVLEDAAEGAGISVLDRVFSSADQSEPDGFYDQLAMIDEIMLESFLENGYIETAQIRTAISHRRVFPCCFGSALKNDGVWQLLQIIQAFSKEPNYFHEFGARIFKITRDDQGNRLTHLKLTGGDLKVKDLLTGDGWEEKVNQIRIYSGQKYETVSTLEAGSICAVTGLSQTRPGEGLGREKTTSAPILEPVLTYQMILPEGCDPRGFLPKIRQMEEEVPELHIVWNEPLQEIQAQIMGEVQIEILQSTIESRFGVVVSFGEGRILYRETIAGLVEGVGHFEPLRHYAEVHLLMEPREQGSGLQFESECSEDLLAKNWQRLILTHLQEKAHKGVLTGAPITDMKITLVSGKAHNKHTEGGDFREATYRAVRQGLMEADSILLEPYYSYQLELPERMVGRAMTDIEQMSGTSEIIATNGETAVLTGSAPVIRLRNYQKDVSSYTKGLGRLFCTLQGYGVCHNPEEVLDQIRYDPENDLSNPTGSVFCANGAGFLVEWFDVKEYMHLESFLKQKQEAYATVGSEAAVNKGEEWIGLDEIDRIMNRTFYANQGRKSAWKRRKTAHESYYESVSGFGSEGNLQQAGGMGLGIGSSTRRDQYLLVDGYNIIHAWPELKELVDDNMAGARMKLLDALSNYQGIRNREIIVVFDAYRVQRHYEDLIDYYNIHVVFTKEAQTADQYIEKFAHDNKKKYDITVATSDGLQQLIIRGSGCALLSARELKEEMDAASEKLRQQHPELQGKEPNYLIDALSPDVKLQMEELRTEENDD